MQEHPSEGIFLGFDVAGDIGTSAIQEGNQIDAQYARRLNANELFDAYADAADFCQMWGRLIEADQSPWEYEIAPRPFALWHVI